MLFFRDCVHLNRTGVFDDNDYATSAVATAIEVNTARGTAGTLVSHMWLRCQNLTGVTVQRYTGGAWVNIETFTPVQKAYAGWYHSLTELTTPVTETRLRLVLSGSSVRVSEVMLLEIGGEVKHFIELVPMQKNRTGRVLPNTRGGLAVDNVIGAERVKQAWRTEPVFGDLNTDDAEDFLDWIDDNPNIVFAQDVEEAPWRVFPATWGRDVHEIRYLTDNVAGPVSVPERYWRGEAVSTLRFKYASL